MRPGFLSRQFALLGVTGAVRMALSLFDMAIWDALRAVSGFAARRAAGKQAASSPTYDSRGLGLMSPTVVDGGRCATCRRTEGRKLRLGYPSVVEDITAVEGGAPGGRRRCGHNGRL